MTILNFIHVTDTPKNSKRQIFQKQWVGQHVRRQLTTVRYSTAMSSRHIVLVKRNRI